MKTERIFQKFISKCPKIGRVRKIPFKMPSKLERSIKILKDPPKKSVWKIPKHWRDRKNPEKSWKNPFQNAIKIGVIRKILNNQKKILEKSSANPEPTSKRATQGEDEQSYKMAAKTVPKNGQKWAKMGGNGQKSSANETLKRPKTSRSWPSQWRHC